MFSRPWAFLPVLNDNRVWGLCHPPSGSNPFAANSNAPISTLPITSPTVGVRSASQANSPVADACTLRCESLWRAASATLEEVHFNLASELRRQDSKGSPLAPESLLPKKRTLDPMSDKHKSAQAQQRPQQQPAADAAGTSGASLQRAASSAQPVASVKPNTRSNAQPEPKENGHVSKPAAKDENGHVSKPLVNDSTDQKGKRVRDEEQALASIKAKAKALNKIQATVSALKGQQILLQQHYERQLKRLRQQSGVADKDTPAENGDVPAADKAQPATAAAAASPAGPSAAAQPQPAAAAPTATPPAATATAKAFTSARKAVTARAQGVQKRRAKSTRTKVSLQRGVESLLSEVLGIDTSTQARVGTATAKGVRVRKKAVSAAPRAARKPAAAAARASQSPPLPGGLKRGSDEPLAPAGAKGDPAAADGQAGSAARLTRQQVKTQQPTAAAAAQAAGGKPQSLLGRTKPAAAAAVAAVKQEPVSGGAVTSHKPSSAHQQQRNHPVPVLDDDVIVIDSDGDSQPPAPGHAAPAAAPAPTHTARAVPIARTKATIAATRQGSAPVPGSAAPPLRPQQPAQVPQAAPARAAPPAAAGPAAAAAAAKAGKASSHETVVLDDDTDSKSTAARPASQPAAAAASKAQPAAAAAPRPAEAKPAAAASTAAPSPPQPTVMFDWSLDEEEEQELKSFLAAQPKNFAAPTMPQAHAHPMANGAAHAKQGAKAGARQADGAKAQKPRGRAAKAARPAEPAGAAANGHAAGAARGPSAEFMERERQRQRAEQEQRSAAAAAEAVRRMQQAAERAQAAARPGGQPAQQQPAAAAQADTAAQGGAASLLRPSTDLPPPEQFAVSSVPVFDANTSARTLKVFLAQAGAASEAATCVERSELLALAEKKIAAWEVRRIETAEQLASQGRCPLAHAQAAVFKSVLGDKDAMEKLFKELRVKVHPDKHRGDPLATRAFQFLISSYKALSAMPGLGRGLLGTGNNPLQPAQQAAPAARAAAANYPANSYYAAAAAAAAAARQQPASYAAGARAYAPQGAAGVFYQMPGMAAWQQQQQAAAQQAAAQHAARGGAFAAQFPGVYAHTTYFTTMGAAAQRAARQ